MLSINNRFLFLPAYVGVATVGASMWWFLLYEEGPQITYYQLVSFGFKKLS